MADQDKKTSALTQASELSDDDFDYIVDKSDTSMAPTGTNKQIEKILNKEYYNYARYTTDNDDHTISERGPIFHTQTKAATDKKVELTDTAANDGQLITVKVVGSSAGLVVLDTVNGATVDGESVDGIAANTKWKWDGNGKLTLRYNHANTDYEVLNTGIWDTADISDTSFWSDQKVVKYTTKLQILFGGFDFDGETGSLQANVYGSTSGNTYLFDSAYTYPVAFKTGTVPLVYVSTPASNIDSSYFNSTATSVTLRVRDTTTPIGQSFVAAFKVVGSWR